MWPKCVAVTGYYALYCVVGKGSWCINMRYSACCCDHMNMCVTDGFITRAFFQSFLPSINQVHLVV